MLVPAAVVVVVAGAVVVVVAVVPHVAHPCFLWCPVVVVVATGCATVVATGAAATAGDANDAQHPKHQY